MFFNKNRQAIKNRFTTKMDCDQIAIKLAYYYPCILRDVEEVNRLQSIFNIYQPCSQFLKCQSIKTISSV